MSRRRARHVCRIPLKTTVPKGARQPGGMAPRSASESFDAPHAPLIATIAVDLALAYFLGALTTRLRLAPLVG